MTRRCGRDHRRNDCGNYDRGLDSFNRLFCCGTQHLPVHDFIDSTLTLLQLLASEGLLEKSCAVRQGYDDDSSRIDVLDVGEDGLLETFGKLPIRLRIDLRIDLAS